MTTVLQKATPATLAKTVEASVQKHLVFTAGLDIKVADLKTGSIDTLFSFKDEHERTRPAGIESLAYHDNNIWVGCAYVGIRNVKDKILIPRTETVFSLVSYKGKLYDAGGYGIRETLTNKKIVSKKQLNERGAYMVRDLFPYDGILMAVCEWNVPGRGPHRFMLRHVELDGRIVAPYGNQPKIATGLSGSALALLLLDEQQLESLKGPPTKGQKLLQKQSEALF